jgi:hypothetical protein
MRLQGLTAVQYIRQTLRVAVRPIARCDTAAVEIAFVKSRGETIDVTPPRKFRKIIVSLDLWSYRAKRTSGKALSNINGRTNSGPLGPPQGRHRHHNLQRPEGRVTARAVHNLGRRQGLPARRIDRVRRARRPGPSLPEGYPHPPGGPLGVPPIGANLPSRVLIRTFSGRLAEVALNGFCGGMQCLRVRLGDNRVDERLDDQAQEAPSAIFYAASRRGESPR